MQTKRRAQPASSSGWDRLFSGLLSSAVDVVLPPRCIITGNTVEHQGMISPKAWAEFDFITAPYCQSCGIPFEVDMGENTRCASCLDKPPKFQRARSAVKYNDVSRKLILGFKHADKTYAVEAFMPWILRAGEQILADADFIAPVPLHRWRLIQRRYNQSALIAFSLEEETGIACLVDLLTRIRSTPSQGHLSAKERIRNVSKAFAVKPHYLPQIKGKKIVLVDDVYTTGATVNECAKILLRAGAGQVDVLTLARVVKPGLG